jgi:ABC-type transport system involved in cytochrome c biogenesis permease subunit
MNQSVSSPTVEEQLSVRATAAPRRRWVSRLQRLLRPLASLRLTVVLFALALGLVFLGTLAQTTASIQTVVNTYFRAWGIVWVPWQLFIHLGQVFFGLSSETRVSGSFPYPTGFTLGGLLLVNLLAAHLVRFRWGWRQWGIWVLHAGLVLLMVGEFITATWAVEGTMILTEGGSANFLEHRDAVELALVERSDPQEDQVVVIPQSLLQQQGVIQHELLPCQVEVRHFYRNARLVEVSKAPPGTPNPADHGVGGVWVAVERPEVAGTSQEEENLPAAYVTFRDRHTGQVLGTYLVSLEATLRGWPPQPVSLDGKIYYLSLRFKRSYRPYTIQLLKFHHEVYPGTDRPKDFSSYIRLVDPSRHEDREVRIWMNHPLRYCGETFYQQSFLAGDRGTVLQVVQNPGWLLPYLACFLVAAGMLFHFGLKLVGFLRRQAAVREEEAGKHLPPVQRRERPAGRGVASFLPALLGGGLVLLLAGNIGLWKLASSRTPVILGAGALFLAVPLGCGLLARVRRRSLSLSGWRVPLIVTACAALYLTITLALPTRWTEPFDLASAAQLPVLDGGRVKPLDTFARVQLLALSGRQTFQDEQGHTQPAIRWLFEVLSSRLREQDKDADDPAANYRVFRIENLDLLNLLELPERPGFRYSLSEIQPRWKEFLAQFQRSRQRRENNQELDLFDNKVLELANRLERFIALRNLELYLVPPPAGGDQTQWLSFVQVLSKLHARRDKADTFQVDLADAGSFNEAAARAWGQLLIAYAQKDAATFNRTLADYQRQLARELPATSRLASLEVLFTDFAPFSQCLYLYVAVFLLACLSWLVWREPLRRAAFWLLLLTFLLHTWALFLRMYLHGRPPVTNLYSSAIFIGWGCVALGLILEGLYRLGLGAAAGSALGFVAVLISHHLALSSGGDTLEMLQAVLDTNFWLATHVTCVTLGYTATLLAGALGLFWLAARGLFRWSGQSAPTTPSPGTSQQEQFLRVLAQMLYGILCFALFFSFVGTVLGGIWADQSWGRFWGWDPKENGALLIVLWNALILHARWGGWIKAPGMARLALAGNMITFWSWFGTNQLGVGLHAYGFNSMLAVWCVVLWLSHLFLLAVEGLSNLPWGRWLGRHPVSA